MRSWTKKMQDAETVEAARAAEAALRRIEDERRAAPFGRCGFTGEPLPDPGTLTYNQAEQRFGWAPCQVRYGRWPNGARVFVTVARWNLKAERAERRKNRR